MVIPGPYVLLAIFIIVIILFAKPLGEMITKAIAEAWNNGVDEIAEEFKIEED